MRVFAGVLAVIAASAAPIMAGGRVQERTPGIGGSLTLRSLIYSAAARVTLLNVIDPATPSYPSKLRPRSGDRWVVVQLKICGLKGEWTDVPANDGQLIDSLKRHHKAFPPEYGTVEPRMPPLGLGPGQVQVGSDRDRSHDARAPARSWRADQNQRATRDRAFDRARAA